MTNKTPLDETTIQSVEAICQAVTRRNAKNQITLDLADGISTFARRNGYLTPKQWQWVQSQSSFHKIPLPQSVVPIIQVEELRPISNPSVVASDPPVVLTEDEFRRLVIKNLIRLDKKMTALTEQLSERD